jgi:hypothetical protein
MRCVLLPQGTIIPEVVKLNQLLPPAEIIHVSPLASRQQGKIDRPGGAQLITRSCGLRTLRCFLVTLTYAAHTMGHLDRFVDLVGKSRLLAPNLKEMTLQVFTGNAHSGNAIARCVCDCGACACRLLGVTTA